MRLQRWLPALILLLASAASGQDVLKLWDGVPRPYYKENSLVEHEEHLWGTTCLANVVDPTVTIFPAKGQNSGIAVLIIPGGNYQVVAIHHEGYDIAEALAARGITGAVLKYRLPDPRSATEPGLVPISDARRALKLLRQRAAQYGMDPRKVGVLGFSAGSHLATVTSLWKSTDPDENPAFSGLLYGVTNLSADNLKWLETNLYFRKLTAEEVAKNRLLDLVDKSTPPTFLAHAYDDDTCKVEESTLYADRLFRAGVPVEMHLFSKGGHGFGIGRPGGVTAQWLPLFAQWLQQTLR